MNRADLISRLEEASEGSRELGWSPHEAGYRAFRQRGLGARNPFLAEPNVSLWEAGFQKAKREASKAAPNNPGEPK